MPTAETWQKEQLSVAFVHAVATRAGYTIGGWKVDKDGVDITLRSRGLMVDLQLKCTSSPKVTKAGYSFSLDTPTYDKLRDKERSAPGYLGLVIAPANVDDWIEHRSTEVLMACHGYWARIQDLPDAATGETKSISIDSSNILDGAAMTGMFDDALRLVKRSVA